MSTLTRWLLISFHLIHVLVSAGFAVLFLWLASQIASYALSMPAMPLNFMFLCGLALATGFVFTLAPLNSAMEQFSAACKKTKP